MKLFLAFALAALAVPASEPGIVRNTDGSVTFTWLYQTNRAETNLVFRLYTSDSLTRPVTNWTLIARIPGDQRGVRIEPTNTHAFFCLTATNLWGR